MLDVITSPVHLKLKYYNLQEESVTINVDLEEAKKIYQALYKDHWEGIAMEIGMSSLTGHLSTLDIHPTKSG